MRYIALPEDLTNELRHACCDKHYFNLRCGLLENFAELALTDELAVPIFTLKKKISCVVFSHELHTGAFLIKSMARNMQTSRTFSNHLNELIFGRHRLLESNLLIGLLYGFDDGFLFFLKFQWH